MRFRSSSAGDFQRRSADEQSIYQRRQHSLRRLVPRSLLGSLALLCHFRLANAAAYNKTPAGCDDEVDWRDSTYGTGCSFYAKHDPGCRKHTDLGQIAKCNVTCGNCEGERLKEFDPLDTTCSMTALCTCFEGCSPATVCPTSVAAQACRNELAVATSTMNLTGAHPWLELRLPSDEHIVGVDVQGAATRYAKTMTVMWSGVNSTGVGSSFAHVDSGQLLPANWEGGHTARVLFEQGVVKARLLRIYPNTTVGDSAWVLRELMATAVVRRCASPVVLTDKDRCDDLKCRAYCYRTLSCKGSWLNYCQSQMETEQVCDVDCSPATRAASLHCLGTITVFLFAIISAMLQRS